MSETTSNHGRVIVTKGTDHCAVTLGPTDVCLVPGPPHPEPFPNIVKSDKLAKGATTTAFIANQPVCTSIGELGPPSDPAHPGVLGGVVSGTYRFEAKATSYSSDVFFEGNAAVRVFDTTTQNHANTTGMVLPSWLALMLAGLDAECLAAAAAAAKMFVAPPPAP